MATSTPFGLKGFGFDLIGCFLFSSRIWLVVFSLLLGFDWSFLVFDWKAWTRSWTTTRLLVSSPWMLMIILVLFLFSSRILSAKRRRERDRTKSNLGFWVFLSSFADLIWSCLSLFFSGSVLSLFVSHLVRSLSLALGFVLSLVSSLGLALVLPERILSCLLWLGPSGTDAGVQRANSVERRNANGVRNQHLEKCHPGHGSTNPKL